MSKAFEYENILELAKTEDIAQSNSYLELGWVLLNVESLQHSEHDWRSSFIFGWPKANGEVKYPEKTAWEKILMQARSGDDLH